MQLNPLNQTWNKTIKCQGSFVFSASPTLWVFWQFLGAVPPPNDLPASTLEGKYLRILHSEIIATVAEF